MAYRRHGKKFTLTGSRLRYLTFMSIKSTYRTEKEQSITPAELMNIFIRVAQNNIRKPQRFEGGIIAAQSCRLILDTLGVDGLKNEPIDIVDIMVAFQLIREEANAPHHQG